MIEQTVRIWRCEHCRKHKHSRWPEGHEEHCFKNPNRIPWEGELSHGRDGCYEDHEDLWRPSGRDDEVFIYHAGQWVSLGVWGHDRWPDWKYERYDDGPCGSGGLISPAVSLKFCPARDRWDEAAHCGYVDG
jgi:hypothetical protein